MNDKDFDKIFGDRLREARQFKEDETEWTRLAARLEGVRRGDSAAIAGEPDGFRRWILPLIALFLLLTTGLLFGKLSHLDKTNAALIEQMKTVETQLNTPLNTPLKTQIDTVFITQIDTVFINNNATEKTLKTTYLTSKTKGFRALNKTNNAGLNNLNNAELIKSNNAELINSNSSINPNNLALINPNFNANSNSKALINFNKNELMNANKNESINANKNELENRINELENKLQVYENQRLTMGDELMNLREKINKTSLKTVLDSTRLTRELAGKSMDKTMDKTVDNSRNNSTNKSDSFNLIIADKDALIAQLNKELNGDLTTKKTIDSIKLMTELKEKGPLSVNDKNTIKINKKPLTSRLFVGANGGLINYKTSWKTGQGIDVFRNEKSYQIGLKLEYALTDRLRLTAGADYCPFAFQIFWQDSRYNLPPPMRYYPSTERIKSSKAVQQLGQGAIGAKYLLTDGKNRWRPYVGAAYTAMKILPFDTEYEVQNLMSGAIWTLKEASTGVNIANLLLLNGGVEYRFNRRFVAQSEAFYNVDMNRPRKTYDLFGVRGALLVNF